LGGLLFWHERETKNEWLGLVISMIGILLLTVEPIFLGTQSWQFGAIDGNMLILFSCITSAWYYLQIKNHYHHIPKLFAAGVSFLVGLVGFTVVLLMQNRWSPQILVDTIWLWSIPTVGGAVFYMAVFVSIIGLTSYILGQDEIEASEASIFTYLQPLVAAPLAFWLLQEKITLLQIVLFTVIIFGVWISQRRRRIQLRLPRWLRIVLTRTPHQHPIRRHPKTVNQHQKRHSPPRHR
jgi:drug/metabolite transporter (DMT)-like permease